MLLSKPSTNGSGRSSDSSYSVCKIVFNVYNFLNKCVSEEKTKQTVFLTSQDLTAEACCIGKSVVLRRCFCYPENRHFKKSNRHRQLPKRRFTQN
jgi:hypothetical protein